MEQHRILWAINDDVTTLREISKRGAAVRFKERKESLEIRLDAGEYMIYVDPDRASASPILQDGERALKFFRRPSGDFYTVHADDERTLSLAKPKRNLELSISVVGVSS